MHPTVHQTGKFPVQTKGGIVPISSVIGDAVRSFQSTNGRLTPRQTGVRILTSGDDESRRVAEESVSILRNIAPGWNMRRVHSGTDVPAIIESLTPGERVDTCDRAGLVKGSWMILLLSTILPSVLLSYALVILDRATIHAGIGAALLLGISVGGMLGWACTPWIVPVLAFLPGLKKSIVALAGNEGSPGYSVFRESVVETLLKTAKPEAIIVESCTKLDRFSREVILNAIGDRKGMNTGAILWILPDQPGSEHDLHAAFGADRLFVCRSPEDGTNPHYVPAGGVAQ